MYHLRTLACLLAITLLLAACAKETTIKRSYTGTDAEHEVGKAVFGRIFISLDSIARGNEGKAMKMTDVQIAAAQQESERTRRFIADKKAEIERDLQRK